MKQRLFVQSLVVLMVGLLSTKLGAQVPETRKAVFIDSIGSAPPPATNSFIFKRPVGVAMGSKPPNGSDLTVYVADPDNNQILGFLVGASSAPNFTIKSLSCPSTVSGCVTNRWTLNQPTYVATTPNGDLWISDTGNDVVVEVDFYGTTVKAFAGAGPYPGPTICTIGGLVYFNVYDPTCHVRGHKNEGQANGQFFGPGPLAVDKNGNLYVADAAGAQLLNQTTGLSGANIRIQKFASDGTWSTTWGSHGGSCTGQLGLVTGLAVDDALNVYTADAANNCVQKFDSGGTYAAGYQQFVGYPGGIAVDPADQMLYVIDTGNNSIQQLDATFHCPNYADVCAMGGSRGIFEAQFRNPFGIATMPPLIINSPFYSCYPSAQVPIDDCIHRFVVSDGGWGSNGNTRVQLLAARGDQDNDGISDDVDTQPNTFSNSFSNRGSGFTTTGGIVDRGDQIFTIYGVLSPSPQDEIRIRTETVGRMVCTPAGVCSPGSAPLKLSVCETKVMKTTLSFPAGTGANIHCSMPTVIVEEGPVGFRFVGSDGTIATATLNTGDALSVDLSASTIHSIAGTIVVVVGGNAYYWTPGTPSTSSVALNPGQSVLVRDTSPPSTTASGTSGTLGSYLLYYYSGTVLPGGFPVGLINCWNTNSVVVTLTAADNAGGSGVNQISYSLSGAQSGVGVITANTGSITVTAQGRTLLTYFATDNSGNQEAVKFLDIFNGGTSWPLACTANATPLLSPGTLLVQGRMTLRGPGLHRLIPFSNQIAF